jgi:hypothetical protein
MILLSLNKGLFGSAIAVVFQSVFHANMYQNDFFFIFLKLFLRSTYQNNPKHTQKLIFSKTKIIF